MEALNYEAEYNNRRRVPESAAIAERWRAASNAYRAHARAALDQPYGPGERHRYDVFFADVAPAPLVVYIHGGYWQWGDREMYAFIAKALNSSGVDVILPSYSLCPTVSVLDIVRELRLCLAVIWQQTCTHPLVVGHSAGGHLTAAMLATDWGTVSGAPSDLVYAGISISSIFDLQPLITTSINGALRLDRDSARAASPRFWSPPPRGRALVAAVGEAESSEFRRQSRDIVAHWGGAGVHTEYLEASDANHFTVLDALALPTSELFARVVSMARDPSPRATI